MTRYDFQHAIAMELIFRPTLSRPKVKAPLPSSPPDGYRSESSSSSEDNDDGNGTRRARSRRAGVRGREERNEQAEAVMEKRVRVNNLAAELRRSPTLRDERKVLERQVEKIGKKNRPVTAKVKDRAYYKNSKKDNIMNRGDLRACFPSRSVGRHYPIEYDLTSTKRIGCQYCSFLLREPTLALRVKLRRMRSAATLARKRHGGEPSRAAAAALTKAEKEIKDRDREILAQCRPLGIWPRKDCQLFCATCDVFLCIRCWGPFHDIQKPPLPTGAKAFSSAKRKREKRAK
jgi:DNA-directed RNA polymerase subunit RPC12/RpoP